MKSNKYGSTGRKHQLGIGFIEILIAAFVITLAVLGLGQMISSASKSASNSKAQSEALVIAEQTLEQLRYYADPNEYETSVVTGTGSDIAGTNAVFTPNISATPSTVVDAKHDPRYRDVTVAVAWEGTDADDPRNTIITDRIALEMPSEAGAKLLSLARGDKPNVDTIYPPNDDEPGDDESSDEPCEGDNCIVHEDPIEVDESELDPDTEPFNGIYVYGSIDTTNNNERIISVGASGNFDPVTCPPNISQGQVQAYECTIGPANTEGGTTWNVTITVTVTEANGTCETSNIYTLAPLTFPQNHFPRSGSLVVPEPICP